MLAHRAAVHDDARAAEPRETDEPRRRDALAGAEVEQVHVLHGLLSHHTEPAAADLRLSLSQRVCAKLGTIHKAVWHSESCRIQLKTIA